MSNTVQGGAGSTTTGGTSMTDDGDFTPGSSSVTPLAIELDDVAPSALGEGKAGIARGSSRRELYIQVRDAAGNERGLNVDASGQIAITIGSVVHVDDNASTLSIDDGGSTISIDDGAGNISIDDGGNSITVDNGGTFAVQESGTQVQVDDAAFTPATSKVLMIGATADETSPDSVNEGDGGAVRMTLDRYLKVVNQDSDLIRASGTERSVTYTAIAAASSGNNTIVTNSNGGLTIRVYAMAIIAAAATNIYFTADAGGTVIFGGSTNTINLAANSGFVLPYNPLGWFQTSANTDVVMNLSAANKVSGGIVTAEV